MDANYIDEILEVDKKSRYLGVQDDIYKLEDLDFTKSWDYSYPTLCLNTISSRQKFNKVTKETYKSEINKKYPFLSKISWENLLFAGGGVGSMLTGATNEDMDFFIYGVKNEREADKRLEKFLLELERIEAELKYESFLKESQKQLEKKIEKNKLEEAKIRAEWDYPKKTTFLNNRYVYCVKQNHVITILSDVSKFKIQVIFRLYDTISEILHGFDLGSSAIGYDGRHIYFTSLSKFAYEAGCNIVDITRRSPTYEERLMKYYERGFEIIMPKFNIKLLKQNNEEVKKFVDLYDVCIMPKLCFSYETRIYGNKIYVRKFFESVYSSSNNDYYEAINYEELDNIRHIYAINIQRLVSDVENPNLVIVGDVYEIDSFKFDENLIRNHYEKIYGHIRRRKSFPTNSVKKNFALSTPEEVFASRNNDEELQAMIEKEIDRVIERLEKSNYDKNNWLIEKRMDQLLTSSFKPIFANEEDWYGKFLYDVDN